MDKRSKRSQPQWMESGIVEAPVEQVWRILLDGNPILTLDDRKSILNQSSPNPFTSSIGKPGEGKIYVEVDRKTHSIAIKGEWWYRGVQSVEAHPRGSLVRYAVYNIAPGIGWWAAQLVQGRQHAHEMPDQFRALLSSIGSSLNCATELLS
jgi:hypothetical protein